MKGKNMSNENGHIVKMDVEIQSAFMERRQDVETPPGTVRVEYPAKKAVGAFGGRS